MDNSTVVVSKNKAEKELFAGGVCVHPREKINRRNVGLQRTTNISPFIVTGLTVIHLCNCSQYFLLNTLMEGIHCEVFKDTRFMQLLS